MKNIILKPLEETQAVTVLILVKVGSRYENQKNQGVAHFIEHLLFKGTKKRPNSLAITKELDSIGAEYNAFTSKDKTGFYVKVAKENLELAIDILADMIFNSKFDNQEINRERGVVIEEMNMYLDNPMMYIDSFLEEQVFKGQDLGRQIIGTKEVIKKITRSEIIKFYKKYYRPENLILGIAGNFSQKKVNILLKKYFKIKDFNQKNIFKKFKNQQKKLQIAWFQKETDQVHLALGFLGLAYNDKNYYAYQLLAIILGGTMSSRLFVKIREKLGLCYYIRAHSESYQDIGVFSIVAGLDKTKIQSALKNIMFEIKRLKKRGVSQQELKRAKKYIKGRLTIKLEDSSSVIAWHVNQLIFKKQKKNLADVLKEFDKVSVEEISLVIKRIFQNNKMSLAFIGPRDESKKIKNIILNNK